MNITARPPALMLAFLLAALVAPSLAFVALPPVLPQIAAAFGGGGKGQAIAQLAQALPFFGLAFGGLVAGACIQRLGVSTTATVSALGLLAAGVAGFLSTGAAPLLASCAALGLLSSLLTSALAAATSAEVAGERRERLLGFQVAVSDLCTVAGGVAAAVLAQSLGWRGPFLIFVGFAAYVLLAQAAARPAPIPRSTPAGGLLRMVRLGWGTYAGAAAVFLLIASQATQLPFYLDHLGYRTAGGRALILTFALVAAVCGSSSYAFAQGRVAPWVLPTIATIAASAGLAGLALWNGAVAPGLAFTFAIGIGIGLTTPTLFSAALRHAPEGLRGHSIGLLNVAIFVGSFLSPLVLTPIAARFGYGGLYGVLSAAVLVLGFGRLAWTRARPPAAASTGPEVSAHG